MKRKAEISIQTLAIASTFTSEPIEDALSFWFEELNLPFRLEFAPYNQVFQQLLDQTSSFHTNRQGANIILVRLEDWMRQSEQDVLRNTHELSEAVRNFSERSSVPLLLVFCPASPDTLRNAGEATLIMEMEVKVAAELCEVNDVHTISARELLGIYPVQEYYDSHANALGHIPYTPEMFAAIATMIARKVHALKRPVYKVIALDCDQTLWTGICGEDGPKGVIIDPGRKALQEILVSQCGAGMILCLCSKNNEEDVFEVFRVNSDMILRQEHIVASRINWRPKWENLISLARDLDLGLDSFLFLEDNPVEIAEVRANCPEVLTIQLPSTADNIPIFLRHLWVLDHLKKTGEDKRRPAMYQENLQRERSKKDAPTFADFLANLQLQIEVAEMRLDQRKRVSQLTQRTNQFNARTIRRSEAEIQDLVRSENFECLAVEVKDRFGDYGLVGAMIFKIQGSTLEIETFLLSCRVLGRGVEHAMLALLGKIALSRGAERIQLDFIRTSKNQPAYEFFNSVGSESREVSDRLIRFSFKSEHAAALTYKPKEPEEKTTEKIAGTSAKNSASADRKLLQSSFMEEIANHLNEPALILQRIHHKKRRSRPALQGNFVAPRTPSEHGLAQIWSEVLHLDRIGVHDDFFSLGGQSLLATQVLSRVRNQFEVDIPLQTLFESPTVATLAALIDTIRWTGNRVRAGAATPAGEREEGEL